MSLDPSKLFPIGRCCLSRPEVPNEHRRRPLALLPPLHQAEIEEAGLPLPPRLRLRQAVLSSPELAPKQVRPSQVAARRRHLDTRGLPQTNPALWLPAPPQSLLHRRMCGRPDHLQSLPPLARAIRGGRSRPCRRDMQDSCPELLSL